MSSTRPISPPRLPRRSPPIKALKTARGHQTMKRQAILKTVYSAYFAAFIFLGTHLVKLPLAIGYIHIGDVFILLAAYLIGGGHAIAASLVGSVLADLLSGYAIYAPATLVIKSTMALIIVLACRFGRGSTFKKLLHFSIGAVLAELAMVLGYYLFEAILYGFSAAFASIPGNALQGVFATVVGVLTVGLLNKLKLSERFCFSSSNQSNS